MGDLYQVDRNERSGEALLLYQKPPTTIGPGVRLACRSVPTDAL